MQEKKVVITLSPTEAQEVERIVLDRDRALALNFVENVVKPQVEAALDKGQCRPLFEWRQGHADKLEPPTGARRDRGPSE